MTTKTDFNEDEWFLIMTTPSMIGSAIATIGKSGVMGTVRELAASSRGIMEAQQLYPNNELIQAIIAKPESRDAAKAYQQKAIEKMQSGGVSNPQQLAEAMLADCQDVVNLLAARATEQESAEYKEWAFQIGQKVAAAAKEGGFLGMGGQQVSDEETALLEQIQAVFASAPTEDNRTIFDEQPILEDSDWGSDTDSDSDEGDTFDLDLDESDWS